MIRRDLVDHPMVQAAVDRHLIEDYAGGYFTLVDTVFLDDQEIIRFEFIGRKANGVPHNIAVNVNVPGGGS